LSFFRYVLLGLSATFLFSPSAYAERLDAIASVVNGEVITCYEVGQDEQKLKTQMKQQGSKLPDESVLFERALAARTMRTIQNQEAEKIGIKVGSDEINAAIADVEKRNHLESGQLESVLKSQNIEMRDYRESIRDRLLNTRLMNIAVRSKIAISEETMREYYRKNLENPKDVREVRISQLFIALPAASDDMAVQKTKAKALAVIEAVNSGEDFTRLVSLQSDAPDASSGGDMGWLSPGAVKGAFAQIFTLKVGEITDVIRSAAGFHILKVTDERMQKPQDSVAYEEVHARHILLKIADSADTKTQLKIRERAEKISQELQNTSDEAFAVRAKELSQGPSASRGGDLGWFKRGQMVPAFEEAAFSLKAGETSGVVNSPFGLHIIRVVEKRTVNPNSFEARKDGIQQTLIEAEMQQQVPRWLNSLKAQAKILPGSCEQVASFKTPESEDVIGEVATDNSNAETRKNENMSTEAEPDGNAAKEALSVWEKAWETQDLETYFNAYDSRVSPSQRFSTFTAWKKYKQRVIPANKNIQVSIDDLVIEPLEQDKLMKLTFAQHFESNTYDDHDKKVLVMENVNGAWKIISESVIKE